MRIFGEIKLWQKNWKIFIRYIDTSLFYVKMSIYYYIYNRYIMKTILNIKVDKDQKEKAKQIAMEMGVPLSTIINAHLREFIRTREFSVKLEPILKPEVERKLLRMSREYHRNKGKGVKFVRSVEEARKILFHE